MKICKLTVTARFGNTIGSSIRDSQELHLCACAFDGSNPPKSGESTPVMGLADRQAGVEKAGSEAIISASSSFELQDLLIYEVLRHNQHM
jgi:hypothetical protein